MKIDSITSHLFEMPLAHPIADARNTIRARTCVLVEVTTENGLVGWGEAASFAGCGSLVAHVIDFFAARLVGRDLFDPIVLFDEMFNGSLHFGQRGLVVNALSGIDVALWDIKARAEGSLSLICSVVSVILFTRTLMVGISSTTIRMGWYEGQRS